MRIVLMMAMTADGLIARNDNHFPDWTSPEDKKLFQKISQKFGVIMFGEKTYKTLPGPLPGRLNVVFTENINQPVVDGVKWVGGDIEKVVIHLESEGYAQALLGGGAYLNSLFLERNLIDELIITVEPLVFGKGLSLFAKELDAKLKLLELKKINNNAYMVHYKVIK